MFKHLEPLHTLLAQCLLPKFLFFLLFMELVAPCFTTPRGILRSAGQSADLTCDPGTLDTVLCSREGWSAELESHRLLFFAGYVS